jgi:sec-independent protein translocase protein TatB
MFDVGWSELMVIGVVAIVVVGPKDLPKMLRTFGNYAGKARRVANDFRRQFDEALREAELDDVRQSVEDLRKTMAVDLNATKTPTIAAPAATAPAPATPAAIEATPAPAAAPAEPQPAEPAAVGEPKP